MTDPTPESTESRVRGVPPAIELIDEIERLEPADLISRFRWGVEHFDRRVVQLDDELLDHAFLPDAGVGNWPVRAVVGHLADAELAFVHRIRRTLAEQSPVFGLWDEHAFIDAGLYGNHAPVGGFIATIYTLRVWTGELLGTLTDEQWARTAMHPEYGPQSVKRIVAIDTWHLERHAWFVNAKIERLLGPAPKQECCGGKAQGGCCGGNKADSGACCSETGGSCACENEAKASE